MKKRSIDVRKQNSPKKKRLKRIGRKREKKGTNNLINENQIRIFSSQFNESSMGVLFSCYSSILFVPGSLRTYGADGGLHTRQIKAGFNVID